MGLQRRADRGDQVQPSGAPPRLRVSRAADGGLRVHDPDDADREDPQGSVEATEPPPVADDPRRGPLPDGPPPGGA